MSRVFVCLFVLFIFSIAVRFGDCENNSTQPDIKCDDENITPGSDKTRMSSLEKMLKGLLSPINIADKILGKDDSESKDTGSFGKILDKFSKYVHFIYPGTLWCGSGDIAREERDLGVFKRTDACCRAHDNCKNDILANKTEVNLKNNGIFTRSACTCDNEFYNCLKKASSPIAFKIGVMYFNLLQPQCFKCVCPTADCNPEDGTECKDQCTKYKWVSSPKY
ncbi:phospholipase A2-like [Temnothorax curvispinosus]|uniref:phospholipase A2 n=1 Tax=Temnothorax curvispinosus TaxID=300111 RepID=A0A6J1PGL1_9HYME|nr:phospholipase A2-like [Temnothorax curvispinosus]